MRYSNIVPTALGLIQGDKAAWLQGIRRLQFIQEGLGICQQPAGVFAFLGVIQDGRVFTPQLPCLEKGGPIDVGSKIGDGNIVNDPCAPAMDRFQANK